MAATTPKHTDAAHAPFKLQRQRTACAAAFPKIEYGITLAATTPPSAPSIGFAASVGFLVDHPMGTAQSMPDLQRLALAHSHQNGPDVWCTRDWCLPVNRILLTGSPPSKAAYICLERRSLATCRLSVTRRRLAGNWLLRSAVQSIVCDIVKSYERGRLSNLRWAGGAQL